MIIEGIGKLYHAYSFWKWGALIIAFIASFTTLISRFKSLIRIFKKFDVSLPSSPLLDYNDSDSDVSCSSSNDEDDDDDDDDGGYDDDEKSEAWRRVDGDFHVRGSGYYLDDDQGLDGNFTWRRRRSGSFGDLFSWPDLGGVGRSGVVKLWDHLDIGDASPSLVLTAERKGYDAMEVSAWDTRAGVRMPALLAEWRQPRRLLGKIIGVDGGGVGKIYVRDDASRNITVGDIRKVNGALTDLTESDVDTW